MRKLCTAALILLLALPATVATAQEAAPERAFVERLPRAWCGSFRWEDDVREQLVTIAFTRVVVLPDGKIEADGPGLVRYQDEPASEAIPFRIRAVIEPATRRIEMFEAIDVPRPGYVTDGSHVGELVPDLQSMRLVWTTRSTGKRGDLELGARPARADLALACAPPAS